MSNSPPAAGLRPLARPEWLLPLAGLLLLFVPTFVDLFRGVWSTEDQAHGPVILALSLWLLYRGWPAMMARSAGAGGHALGWPLFAAGLLMYVLGRSQQIALFELAAFICVLAGVLLVKRGGGALAQLWFPFFFMLFMIPLPGALVSMLTMPMKMAVSYVVEHLLFWAGYPIARTGVILQIGQYQLLVADACAGLQTFLTLESLGLFYLNVVRHTSALRNIGIALLIVPISFTANVIRVIVLTLITYYFGDAAGQGFLHGFAGMVLFVSALSLILGVDTFLQWMVKRRARRHDGGRP
ncbi:exosortase B [Duganella sp. BJB488]|uniref:exosortase B n=1 Tax=unclassified Duganella TaxID=2636909 RepID=UPI000E34EFA0|nr:MULTISPECIES: exosortase B [unclassified Duganella]NVD73923.1 exosortase B [Duganella sp. BJB1802]RFP12495.1 exosortase B [Duganella sp. BJB489]RFP16613.1 exosortase B [Duganella sp. BJB488]RFP30858.1 exosortase B [Duganella sp. BJB480]